MSYSSYEILGPLETFIVAKKIKEMKFVFWNHNDYFQCFGDTYFTIYKRRYRTGNNVLNLDMVVSSLNFIRKCYFSDIYKEILNLDIVVAKRFKNITKYNTVVYPDYKEKWLKHAGHYSF